MATEIATSTKRIGGAKVQPGNYVIHRAYLSTDVLKQEGKEDRPYDTLEVVLHALNQGNSLGAECPTRLRLNGCWRPRKGADGQPHQDCGTFYDKFLQNCRGMDFTAGRDWINNNLRGFVLQVAHDQYPSTTGDFGTTYRINVSTQAVISPAALPALPPVPQAAAQPVAQPTSQPVTQPTVTQPTASVQGASDPMF